MAFTAMNKEDLDNAFNTITQQIVNQGHYSTNVGGDAQFDGYLTFSDVLGEYMEFGSFRGLWYDNKKYTGNTFESAMGNAALRSNFCNTLAKQMLAQSSANTGAVFNPTIAATLLTNNLAAAASVKPKNVISYYTNKDRVYTGPAYGPGGVAIPAGANEARVDMYIVQSSDAVDSETGDASDLMYVIFQVVTALVDGEFPTADPTGGIPPGRVTPTLRAGDQTVRWFIPAALIPLRNVEPVKSGSSTLKDDFGYTVYQVQEANPLRTIYTVKPRVNAIGGDPGMTSEYMNANKAPGENSYYFYTNRWRGLTGAVTRGDLANMSLAFFVPADTNTYYMPPPDTRGTVPKQPVPVGLTGTSPFTWEFARFSIAANNVEVQRLGNNGRLQLRVEVPISVYKTFDFSGATWWPGPVPPEIPGLDYPDLTSTPPRISTISFTMIGFGTDGNEIYRKVLYLKDFTWNAAENRYELLNIPVPPGDYTFSEKGGFALGFIRVMMPLSVGHYPNKIDPRFNYATLHNAYTNALSRPDAGLYIKKAIHGLRPAEELAVTYSITLHNEFGSEWGPFDQTDFAASPYGVFISESDPLLVPGKYWLEENVNDFGDFVLTVDPDPLEFTLDQDQIDTGFMFTVDNIYSKPSHEIEVAKELSGLTGTDVAGNPVVPHDLAFKIEGKDKAWNPSSPWNTTSLATIRYSDLTGGSYSLSGLPSGIYTITEIGADILGFDLLGVNFSASPISLVNNPDGTPNSYMFTLDTNENAELKFTFTNSYRRTPDDPPPKPPAPTPTPSPTPSPPPDRSPQTGDTRSIIIPIAMLSLGLICIAGAEVFRRHFKKAKKK